MYEYTRKEHPEWPEPLPLVRASLEELLVGRRTAGTRQASGRLAIRQAQPGDRYRTWRYGLTRRRPGGVCRREATRTLSAGAPARVLVAYEGRRLVGSAVIYFVDTLSEEDTDIREITGPASVGPIFTKASYDWGGHAIVMDSFWVAPDRRRAGIATAMAERIAEIGLPAWGEFRDPWFAAFFLHRWPPTRSIRRGRYWPLYEEYLDASDWADEGNQECAELDITLWLSDAELTEMTETSESAVELLDDAMDPDDDVRGGLDAGGWELDIQHASLDAHNGGWRLAGHVTVTYLVEALLTRARLEAYLLTPFDSQPAIDTLGQALEMTVIEAVRRRFDRGNGRVERWQLSSR
jgi:GNAT superfamily N-acetyltransferase